MDDINFRFNKADESDQLVRIVELNITANHFDLREMKMLRMTSEQANWHYGTFLDLKLVKAGMGCWYRYTSLYHHYGYSR